VTIIDDVRYLFYLNFMAGQVLLQLVRLRIQFKREGLRRDMVGGPKFGLLVTLARTRRRRIATSLFFSIAVGFAIISVLPLLLAFGSCGSSSDPYECWVFVAFVALVFSHFIMVPIAIFVSAYAFYSCSTKFSALAGFSGLTSSGWPISPPDLRPRTPMRKVFRAAGVGWFILLALELGSTAYFSYERNYMCAAGSHIILSDADAIEQAQKQFNGAHIVHKDGDFGVADFNRANCCEVERTRTGTGVIIWKVGIEGETIGEPKKRHVSAHVELTNCGELFVDGSYVIFDPVERSN
jgi:hypothetical protein